MFQTRELKIPDQYIMEQTILDYGESKLNMTREIYLTTLKASLQPAKYSKT